MTKGLVNHTLLFMVLVDVHSAGAKRVIPLGTILTNITARFQVDPFHVCFDRIASSRGQFTDFTKVLIIAIRSKQAV